MKFNFQNHVITSNTNADVLLANLAKVDEMAKPIRLVDFLDKLPRNKQITDGIRTAVFNVRESIGKQIPIIDQTLTRVQCILMMRANKDTCELVHTADNTFAIQMSHDIYTCIDMEHSTERLAIAIAQILEHKIYNTTSKRFTFQLLYYLMGFDPMKEAKEREEAKKILAKV